MASAQATTPTMIQAPSTPLIQPSAVIPGLLSVERQQMQPESKTKTRVGPTNFV